MDSMDFKHNAHKIKNVRLYALQQSLSKIELYDEDWLYIAHIGMTTNSEMEVKQDISLAYGESILGVVGKVSKLPIQCVVEF